MINAKFLALAAASLLIFGLNTAQAMPTDHVNVKAVLEQRFGIAHREVGMTTTSIQSSDCSIRIVDGSDAGKGTADQAALQVMKNGKVLSFFISSKMSYDIVLGSMIDLTANKASGLSTHVTLLKIGERQLRLTQLSLYPSENEPADQQTLSLTCQL